MKVPKGYASNRFAGAPKYRSLRRVTFSYILTDHDASEATTTVVRSPNIKQRFSKTLNFRAGFVMYQVAHIQLRIFNDLEREQPSEAGSRFAGRGARSSLGLSYFLRLVFSFCISFAYAFVNQLCGTGFRANGPTRAYGGIEAGQRNVFHIVNGSSRQ